MTSRGVRAFAMTQARRRLESPLLAAAFVVGYVALDWLSFIHPMQQYNITPWNPQPALAIALMMRRGQKWLPVVILAAVAAEWVVRGASMSAISMLVVGCVLGLAYAAIARALSGPLEVQAALASRRDAIRLVAVVAVGALVTGMLYIAALVASGVGPIDRPLAALVRCWIGDAVGILVTLPVILTLSVPERRAELFGMLRKPEMIGYGLLTTALLALVFTRPSADEVKIFYVLFLPLILVAVRFGVVGASLATLVIQGSVIVTGELADVEELTVVEFQALLIAFTVTGLFLGVTVDERRVAERELQRTTRLAAAGEMAAALAHELNQPLAAVLNYARASRLIAESPAADRTLLLDTLAKLVAECSRAADVVKKLRDFFRTGATELKPLAVRDIVSKAMESVRAAADEGGVEMRMDAAPPGPAMLGDETQMHIVLRNLLANAISAASSAPAARTVEVSLDANDMDVLLTVRDSGRGVAPADAQRIFEPFETTRASGMGMGLAISRAIVEAHGGRLWAEPARQGIFHVSLPLKEVAIA